MGDFVPSAETSGARQGGEGPEEQRSLLLLLPSSTAAAVGGAEAVGR